MYAQKQYNNSELTRSRIQANFFKGGIILLYLIFIDLIFRALILSRPIEEWALSFTVIIVYSLSTILYNTNKESENGYFLSKKHLISFLGIIMYIFLVLDLLFTYSLFDSLNLKEYSYIIMCIFYTLFLLKSCIIFTFWILNRILEALGIVYSFKGSFYTAVSIIISFSISYLFTPLKIVAVHQFFSFLFFLFLFLIPKWLPFILSMNLRKYLTCIFKGNFSYLIVAILCSLFLSVIISLNQDISGNLITLIAKSGIIFSILILPLLKNKLM